MTGTDRGYKPLMGSKVAGVPVRGGIVCWRIEPDA